MTLYSAYQSVPRDNWTIQKIKFYQTLMYFAFRTSGVKTREVPFVTMRLTMPPPIWCYIHYTARPRGRDLLLSLKLFYTEQNL